MSLRPIERLRFTFPDGSTFSATGDVVRRVNPSRDGGPIPTLEIDTSFNDERPWLAVLSFLWPPRRAARR